MKESGFNFIDKLKIKKISDVKIMFLIYKGTDLILLLTDKSKN